MSGNLILIPARGGSTRIKRKNIKLLGDKPLVGHVISAGVASGAMFANLAAERQKLFDENYGTVAGGTCPACGHPNPRRIK